MSDTEEHVVTPGVYLAVYSLLMTFTALTVAVAYVDLGTANVVIMLVIAAIKGSAVVLWFMHLRWGTRLTGIVLASGFLWLMLLIGITTTDMVIRGPATSPYEEMPAPTDVGTLWPPPRAWG
jgi:cytochrome c oxidase subunit IV